MSMCKLYNVKFIYVGNIGTLSIIYSDSDNIINNKQKLLHVYHLAINKFIKKYKTKPFNEKFTHSILYFSNHFYNELFGRNLTMNEYYIINKYCENQKKCNFLMYYTIYNLYTKIFNEKKNYKCEDISSYKYYNFCPSKISGRIDILLNKNDIQNKHIHNKLKKYANISWIESNTTVYDKTHDVYYNSINCGINHNYVLGAVETNKLELFADYICRYEWENIKDKAYVNDVDKIVGDFTNDFFGTINRVTSTYIKFRDFDFNKENLIYYCNDNHYINYNNDRYNDIQIHSLLFSGMFIWKYNVCSNTECVRIAQLIWNYLFVDEIKKYKKFINEYNIEPLIFEQNELNCDFIYYMSNIWAYIFKFDYLNREQVVEIMMKHNHSDFYDISPYEMNTSYDNKISFYDKNKIAQLFNNIFALKFNIRTISNINKTLIFNLKNTITEIYKSIIKTIIICSRNENYIIFNIIEKILKSHQ